VVDIPVADIGADERISIGFQSSTFCLDGESNAVGAGIDKIEVRRRREESEHARNSLLVTRFPGGKHWIKEDAFLYGELLHPAGELRQLCFVGGEPLVVNETARVIEYLAEKGEPEKCILNFTTNGTIFDERLLRTSALFKQVVVVVSLDGVDGLLEYIRYPANWTTVKSNLKRFAGLDNVILRISATFQAYNALNFVPLLRFCDEEGYEILFNVLCFPEYLAATVLPPSARLLAAERLRKYIETADTRQNVQQILSLANMLEGAGDAVDRDMLRKFMEFTNDLDKSRGQVLEDVAPEIKDCMREDGVPWSTKTVYA
jgi:MoaA/NifB/PqqE/SkfB family radical SAM enzyme